MFKNELDGMLKKLEAVLRQFSREACRCEEGLLRQAQCDACSSRRNILSWQVEPVETLTMWWHLYVNQRPKKRFSLTPDCRQMEIKPLISLSVYTDGEIF